jgi:3-oxoadipate enol-lactonase
MPIARIGDLDLHYREAGDGPPLVFVHGLGGSATDWEHQLPFFSARYRVIVPELRGFGDTPRGQGLPSIPRFAADLRGLLDHLGVDDCHLIGHSMGGAVSLQFTLDHPRRVRRLVIANSVPSFQPQSARHYFEFAYRWIVMGLLGPARLARIGARRMFPEPHQEAQRARSIARGERNTRAAYLGALAALGRWSVIPRLAELQMPVLVVAAEHDYFGHAETVKFAHALPRGRLHVVDGARHGLPSERADEFNTIVQKFLDARPPRRRHEDAT